MRKVFILILIVFSVAAAEMPRRPVSTYSIVARDSVTGDMGVAVQSHWFSVGSVVSWAEAGVGAVATQSFAEISYGPLGLDLMREGKTAQQALEALLAVDPYEAVRQVAMVDRHGNVAVHTGDNCLKYAGHAAGPQFSCQANMMAENTVWPAMAQTFKSTDGDLLERFMSALEAAQAEGGDIRGKQSVAILIVPGSREVPSYQRSVDLRIEDHPEPLKEMRRLVRVHRAYEHMNRGDHFMTVGALDSAQLEYEKAMRFYPENVEIPYWTAIGYVNGGQLEKALPIFAEIFREHPEWRELTRRLEGTGNIPDDPEMLQKILAAGTSD